MMWKFKIDWTFNVTNFISAITFVGMLVGAWYQTREDVHMLQYQYVQLDKKTEEIKQNQENNRKEISQELSNLRNQFTTSPKTRN